jgi:hypothetical protein
MDSSTVSRLASAAVALLLLAGCGRTPAITTYTVAKDIPDRMLGGILLQDDKCWFFKLTGPRDEVERQRNKFQEFLESVEMRAGHPTWTLPEGWQIDDKANEAPAPVFKRFATILVPLKSKPAELTVTNLAVQGDERRFLVENINRWRGQMSQQNLSPSDWKSLSQVETKSGPAYLVNISGRLKGGGMAPPFAGRGGM